MTEFVTKEELQLHLKNNTLEITKSLGTMLDAKFEALESRFDKANIDRRNNSVLEVTGNSWDDRQKTRDAIAWAESAAKTNKKIKVITLGVFITGFLGWVAKNMNFGSGGS